MGKLVGLPGVNGRELDTVFFSSVGQAMKLIDTNESITGAGDNGAISVWRDDDGNYRADFSRHWASRGSGIFKTKKALREWLKTWMPHMHSPTLPEQSTQA